MKKLSLLALVAGLTAFAQPNVAGADAKDDKNPVNVKLALDKTELPIPVKFAFSVELREYCISRGLDTEVKETFYPPR